MGLFDGLIGNASEVNLEKLQEEVRDLLIPNETIKNAYKIIRDTFIFTNKRLIISISKG